MRRRPIGLPPQFFASVDLGLAQRPGCETARSHRWAAATGTHGPVSPVTDSAISRRPGVAGVQRRLPDRRRRRVPIHVARISRPEFKLADVGANRRRTWTYDNRFRKPVGIHLCVGRRNAQPAYQRIPTSAIRCQRVPTAVSGRSRWPASTNGAHTAAPTASVPTSARRCQPL